MGGAWVQRFAGARATQYDAMLNATQRDATPTQDLEIDPTYIPGVIGNLAPPVFGTPIPNTLYSVFGTGVQNSLRVFGIPPCTPQGILHPPSVIACTQPKVYRAVSECDLISKIQTDIASDTDLVLPIVWIRADLVLLLHFC